MAELFDHEGNIKGEGEMVYVRTEIKNGSIMHSLKQEGVSLLWGTYKDKVISADIEGHYIGKPLYDLIAHMIKINEGMK